MRRTVWAAAAASVAVTLALSACGGGSTAGGGSGNGAAGDFVVYSADAGALQATQQMLQTSFGDPNHVKIKVVAYPAADFLSQFQNAVRSNTEIDGLILNGQHVRFLQSKDVLAPLDGVVDTSSLQAAAVDPFKIKDKVYAAGVGTLNTSMMAVNADLVKKYDLVVPKTFDDIKADVAKLKGTGVSLLGFGGATVFQWPMWYMEMLQQTSHDQPIELTNTTVSGGRPDFTGAPYVEAMQHLKDLGASGAFQPSLIGTANTAAQADFLAGKSVMYWYGSWVISQFVQQAKFTVDIAPFPAFVDGVTPRPTGGVYAAVAMYSRAPSGKVALAKKFVQFMTSPDGNKQYMTATKQSFILPATKNTTVDSQTPLEKQVIADYLPKTFTFLDWIWPAPVITAFQQNIQAVVGQQKSPEAAMKDIQAAFASATPGG